MGTGSGETGILFALPSAPVKANIVSGGNLILVWSAAGFAQVTRFIGHLPPTAGAMPAVSMWTGVKILLSSATGSMNATWELKSGRSPLSWIKTDEAEARS